MHAEMRKSETRIMDMQNQLPRNWMRSKANAAYLSILEKAKKSYKSRYYFFLLIGTIMFYGPQMDIESFPQDFKNMVNVKRQKIANSNKLSPELKYFFNIEFDYIEKATEIFFMEGDYKKAIATPYIRDKCPWKLAPRTRSQI